MCTGWDLWAWTQRLSRNMMSENLGTHFFFQAKWTTNQVQRSTFCPLGGFPFPTVLRGRPRKKVQCFSSCKPDTRFPLPHSAGRREFLMRSKVCGLRENKPYSKSRGPGHLGHFFMQLTCAFRACFVPISYVPPPFDDDLVGQTEVEGLLLLAV